MRFCALCGCPLQPLDPASGYNQQAPMPGKTRWQASMAAHHAIVHDDLPSWPGFADGRP